MPSFAVNRRITKTRMPTNIAAGNTQLKGKERKMYPRAVMTMAATGRIASLACYRDGGSAPTPA